MVKRFQEKSRPSTHHGICMLEHCEVLLDEGLHVGATVREKCPYFELSGPCFLALELNMER